MPRPDKSSTAPAPVTVSVEGSGEWKTMLGHEELPFEKRPIYAYTLARLKAAETRRQEKLRAAGRPAAVFVPRWEEVQDPEVRKFIARVPKFGGGGVPEDVDMDMTA